MRQKTRIFLIIILFFLQNIVAESFTFATYPFGEEKNIYSAFSTLMDYLSEKTGHEFRLVITKNYNELSERIIEGSVDFAWIGSANYVKTLESTSKSVYLATYQEWNPNRTKVQPYYHSVILTLKSSPYTDLESMKGIRFAFTSPDSTSGYAYPRMIFHQLGIIPDDFFSTVFYMGSHSNVIKALTTGSIDAGACSDGTFYKALTDYGDIFRILKFSEPIPMDAIVALDHVDPEKRRMVRELLIAIDTDHPVNESILDHLSWPAAGFQVKNPDFYDSIKTAMQINNAQ